jgi:hypothetical protein
VRVTSCNFNATPPGTERPEGTLSADAAACVGDTVMHETRVRIPG